LARPLATIAEGVVFVTYIAYLDMILPFGW